MTEEESDGRARQRSVTAYVALVALAAAVGAVLVSSGPAPRSLRIPLVAIAVASALAELPNTAIRYRGETIEITGSHVALTFGLLFVPRAELIIAVVLAASVVRLTVRRQAPVKFFFNIAAIVLDAVVAVAVFDALGGGSTSGPTQWLIVLAALSTSSAVLALVVTGVITVATGRPSLTALSVAIGVVMSAAIGSVGLAAATAYAAHPVALALFALPLALTFGAFVAFERQRQQTEEVEFLYRITRSWTSGQAVNRQLEQFLEACVDGLMTTSVDLVAYAKDRSEFRFHAHATESDQRFETGAPDPLIDRRFREAMQSTRAARIVSASGEDPLAPLVRSHGVTRGIVAPLSSGTDVFGLLVLGDRDAEIDWNERHVALVTALSEVVAPVIASEEHLATIAEMRELQDQLSFQANHDQLTGLANRALFATTLDELGTGHDVGVLYLDLDGFKPVNDELGHTAGDALLRAVAARLRGAVRSSDLVARLGGDEFAIVMHVAPGGLETLVHTARRVVETIGEPFTVERSTVTIGASVGVTIGAHDDSPATLIRRADEAMYAAKHDGKGRCVVVTADRVVHRSI